MSMNYGIDDEMAGTVLTTLMKLELSVVTLVTIRYTQLVMTMLLMT